MLRFWIEHEIDEIETNRYLMKGVYGFWLYKSCKFHFSIRSDQIEKATRHCFGR